MSEEQFGLTLIIVSMVLLCRGFFRWGTLRERERWTGAISPDCLSCGECLLKGSRIK